MSDSGSLRERASILFALALIAREQGMRAYAETLTKMASEALAKAKGMERRRARSLMRAYSRPRGRENRA
jgi:hypothetical protein